MEERQKVRLRLNATWLPFQPCSERTMDRQPQSLHQVETVGMQRKRTAPLLGNSCRVLLGHLVRMNCGLPHSSEVRTD